MKPTIGFLAAALTAGALALSAPAQATDNPNELSPANQAIFTTDHLDSITEPVTISYDFEKKGSLEKGFTDKVEEKVTNIQKTGRKDLDLHFLSGDNYMELPPYLGTKGNPLTVAFLEWDVREMQRLTGGNALFFRRLILNALAGSATVKPVTFTLEGKSHDGTEVNVQPYVHGELVERFPQYEYKTYTFVLSKDIPGGIYRITAVTPGTSEDKPLTDASLTYHGVSKLETKRSSADRAKTSDVAEKTGEDQGSK